MTSAQSEELFEEIRIYRDDGDGIFDGNFDTLVDAAVSELSLVGGIQTINFTDGDLIFVNAVDTSGTVGQVSDNGDGTFDYDPNEQFENLDVGESVPDSFTYTLSDGESTNTAMVTITITGVNNTTTLYLPQIMR